MNNHKKIYAYIGGWGYNESIPEHGFSICKYHADTGALTDLEHTLPDIRVGGTCIHPSLNICYCTDERTASNPDGGGQVLAFLLDPLDGSMTELNRQPSYACSPAYCATDSNGEYLVVANHGGNGMITKTRLHSDGTYSLCREYDEANITLFPLNVDGSISSPSHIIRLTGNGPRKSQKSSHPHSIMASPDGKIFIVCDFGADRIYSFTIDRQKNILKTAYEYKVPAGSAPRYSAFHPKKPYFFVNNEVRPYVESFLYAENGTFEKVDELYVLPDNAVPDQLPLISDIRIHPTGKYLYNLSRTYNTVTVIGINETTGKMKILQLLELTGDFPKGCNISPDGSYLYIAMKKSGEVLLCRIAENGLLTLSDLRFPVQNAANITFYESGTN